MNNEFLNPFKKYKHFSGNYTAVYIGKGWRNKHTYKVIKSIKGYGLKVGDIFTPNEPEKYFSIIKK